MEPATSFQTFDPTLRPPRAQTTYAKGRRGRLLSPVGLGNQGLVQQGQPEVRGIPKHTVTLSPRRMPDALVGILLQKEKYMNKYGME